MKPEAELLTYALERLEASNEEWRTTWGELCAEIARSNLLIQYRGYECTDALEQGKEPPPPIAFDDQESIDRQAKLTLKLKEAQEQVESWTRTVRHVTKSLFDMYR